MSIQEALSNYHNSLYYNKEWHRLTIDDNYDENVFLMELRMADCNKMH